jgi:PAS domain S-box-containing protein
MQTGKSQSRSKEKGIRKAGTRVLKTKAIIDDSGALVCRCRPDAVLTFVNDTHVRYFRESRKKLVGKSFLSLVPETQRAAARSALADMVSTPKTSSFKHQTISEDGKLHWLEWINRPILDETGAVVEFVSIGYDITESQRTQELCNLLIQSIPCSILLLDENMRIVFANHNFLENVRLEETLVKGNKLRDVFPEIIIDELGMEAKIRQVFMLNKPTSGERMTYRAPGVPTRTFFYRIIPVCSAELVESVILIMEDVTEQIRLSENSHRAAQHLSSVVDSISDIVISTDMQGTIITSNPAASIVLGRKPCIEEDQNFLEFCIPEHRKNAGAVIDKLACGIDAVSLECEMVNADGEGVPVSWIISAMKDEHGRPVGLVLAGRDLSERRKFEYRLVQQEKLAALGVMAGGIAHELRNPLAICYSAAQFLIQEDVSPAFHKECVDRIIAGVQRASGIIENLLRFARPSSRRERQVLNLADLLREALTLVENEMKLQGIKCRADCLEEEVKVLGSRGMLQQVFINLFLNALRAMNQGGKLSLSTKTDDDRVRISVTDTGCGIAPKALTKIFDPFYTSTREGTGTGLGLSLCYSIMVQHNGTIEAVSQLGKGSTFTVTLPQVK